MPEGRRQLVPVGVPAVIRMPVDDCRETSGQAVVGPRACFSDGLPFLAVGNVCSVLLTRP